MTSPLDLGGTPLAKTALVQVLWIGMLINYIPISNNHTSAVLARDVPPKSRGLVTKIASSPAESHRLSRYTSCGQKLIGDLLTLSHLLCTRAILYEFGQLKMGVVLIKWAWPKNRARFARITATPYHCNNPRSAPANSTECGGTTSIVLNTSKIG